MIYKSKKDSNILAKLVEEDEERKTVILEYLTGDKSGKSICVTTPTLKRWWKKVNEDEIESIDISVETPKEIPSVLKNLDYEKINTPYPEPKEQKYIPKPKSVIEYEAKKKRNRGYNTDLPDFESLVDLFGPKLKKVNKSYLLLNDGSSIWRYSSNITFYVTQNYFEKFTHLGLISKSNEKDKERPYKFEIKTIEELDKVKTLIMEEK